MEIKDMHFFIRQMKLVPLWLHFLSSISSFNNPPKRIKLHMCYASLTDQQNESFYTKVFTIVTAAAELGTFSAFR